MVWRDVKPENFLFATEDNDSPLKAVDFGTAERCKPDEFITARAGGLRKHGELSAKRLSSMRDGPLPLCTLRDTTLLNG